MSNPHKGRTGLDRIVRAMGYSLDGLKIAYHGESAFRQEIWLAAVLLPAAFWLGRSGLICTGCCAEASGAAIKTLNKIVIRKSESRLREIMSALLDTKFGALCNVKPDNGK